MALLHHSRCAQPVLGAFHLVFLRGDRQSVPGGGRLGIQDSVPFEPEDFVRGGTTSCKNTES